jgi:hypothetical protein
LAALSSDNHRETPAALAGVLLFLPSVSISFSRKRSTGYWERGRPRPHCAAGALFLTIFSRYPLNAGEGARAPSKGELLSFGIERTLSAFHCEL